jgi:small-conductance mechanosensitive channel
MRHHSEKIGFTDFRFNHLAMLLTFVLLTIAVTPVYAQKDKTKKKQDKKTETSLIKKENYIPVMKLNSAVRDFFLKLGKLHGKITPVEEIKRLDTLYSAEIDSIKTALDDSTITQFKKKSFIELNYLKRYWNTTLDNINQKYDDIESQLEDMQSGNHEIVKKLKIWRNTLDTLMAGDTADLRESTMKYINTIIDTLIYYKDLTERNIDLLLELQDKVVVQQYGVKKLLEKIEDAELKKRSLIFTIDYSPIWKSLQDSTESISFTEAITNVYSNERKSLILFIESNRDGFIFHIIFFIVILALLIYLRYTYREDEIKVPLSKLVNKIEMKNLIYRPISSAFFVTIFSGFFIYTNRTDLINSILYFLTYLTILRLLWGIVDKKNTWFFIAFGFVYLSNQFVKLIEGDIELQRWIVLFNTIIALGTLIFFFRPKSKFYKMPKGAILTVIFFSGPVFIILLLASLLGNILGAVGFSILATSGFIDLAMLTIILIAASFLAASISIVLLTKHFRNKPELEELYLESFSHTSASFIRFFAIVLWFLAGMRIFGVRDLVYYWFDELMNFTITSGDTEIRIGAVLSFFFIIIISFVLAKLVRLFLDIEIFSRIKLPRGIPGAISMVIKYSIVFIGIYLAISSIGIDFGKFGLLAGAMGVGLGFGLQNILSNFFSGIILAFERPVQTGDLVEIDNVYGRVQSIGVRSSIVRTLDGSEVILPNSDLISKQLINWTMRDTKRRIQLKIKTAFDENPHKVIEIVLNAINSRPEVLQKPSPLVVFNGFGDFFLEFTAYYWIKENYLVNKSKIALIIYDNLTANNIKTPRQYGDFNVNVTEEKIKYIESKKRDDNIKPNSDEETKENSE